MAPRISSYMTSDVKVVTPSDTLAHARRIMLRHGIGRLVVVDENEPSRPIGMLTITDIMDALLGRLSARPIDSILVGEVYTPDPITIERTRTVKSAAILMLRHKIGGLPVVDEKGSLVGIITRSDLVRAYADRYHGYYKVADIMRRDFPTATKGHSIFHVAKIVMAEPSGKVVVVDGDRVVGVVTKRDLAFANIPPRGRNAKFYKVKSVDRYRDKVVSLRVYNIPIVEDVMTPDPITIEPDRDSADAAAVMVREGIGILPVVGEGEKLQGIVTKLEILEAMASK